MQSKKMPSAVAGVTEQEPADVSQSKKNRSYCVLCLTEAQRGEKSRIVPLQARLTFLQQYENNSGSLSTKRIRHHRVEGHTIAAQSIPPTILRASQYLFNVPIVLAL